MPGAITSWRERGGRRVRLALPFDDIMEIALALLSLLAGRAGDARLEL
jgi:hypothetical protein